MKKISACVVLLILLSTCGGEPIRQSPIQNNAQGTPQPANVPIPLPVPPDKDGNYQIGYGMEQDLHIYTIRGVVLAAPDSIVNYSFEGRTYGRSSGYISGGTEGKGIVRFKIETVEVINPYEGIVDYGPEWVPLVKPGQTVILKVIDLKGSGLQEGDRVTFRCRQQSEFSNAVAGNEIPTTRGAVDELDYCRLATPVIEPVVITR